MARHATTFGVVVLLGSGLAVATLDAWRGVDPAEANRTLGDPTPSRVPTATGVGPASADLAPAPPLGLPRTSWPSERPYSAKKVELGKRLFFDVRLSSDGTVACASCHRSEKAFSDGRATSVGIGGRRLRRNAPTLVNQLFSSVHFWDGRSDSLEEQAKGPLADSSEMSTDPSADLAYRHLIGRLGSVPGYVERFRHVFGTADFSIDHVAEAIAAFERTIFSGNSPYDRHLAGDPDALAPEQIRGMDVFFRKAACDRCHLASEYIDDLFYDHDERLLRGRRIGMDVATGREQPQIQGFNFTDGSFQNTGIGMDRPDADLGRSLVTRDASHTGSFKTPTLREIEHTAPYMHDGSLATLEDVIDYYDRGGIGNPYLSEHLKPLHLTSGEKRDLVSFLKALSGEGWQGIEAPDPLPAGGMPGGIGLPGGVDLPQAPGLGGPIDTPGVATR